MNLSISHIAWPPEQEEPLLELLQQLGVNTIEAAPQRLFGNPLHARETDVRETAERYRTKGFHIGSFQALLFGAEGLFLFQDDGARERMKEWLEAVAWVAGWCGAGPMVFGSPKNRLKGELSHAAAMKIAVPFFREIGDVCAVAGSCLVMEANPLAYGADFCVCLEEAAELVARVDSPGFRLHLDAGGLALSGEQFEPVMAGYASWLGHLHASQPHLVGWEEPHPVHARLAAAARDAGYCGDVAIEMRSQSDVAGGVERAVNAVRIIYGPW